jgi:hypothetical protein
LEATLVVAGRGIPFFSLARLPQFTLLLLKFLPQAPG